MKALLFLVVMVSQVVEAEEIIGLKFSKIQSMAVYAIVKEERANGVKLTAKDVTDLELVFVRENEIEVAGVAPGYKEEDGIPNYCGLTLARANDYSEYVVKDVQCSPWD